MLFERNKISLLWSLLGVVSLAVAGLLSLSVVFLRIPHFASVFINPQHYFDLSLAVHVNLSVLVWLTSIGISGITSILDAPPSKIDFIAFFGVLLSMLLIVGGLFFPDSAVYKSNYIPVIQNAIFLSGIFLFMMFAFIGLHFSVKKLAKCNWFYHAGCSMMTTFGCAIVAFFASYAQQSYYNDVQFYEVLFWGGGHILQFFFVEAFVLLCCLQNEDLNSLIDKRIMCIGYMIITCVVIASPFVYLIYRAPDPYAMEFFTKHMIFGGIVLPSLFFVSGLRNFRAFFKSIFNDTALLTAFLLCIYGGILGFMIIKGNVTVPAHYHGSVVSITIIFMGFVYRNLGVKSLPPLKLNLPSIQIYMYALGQFVHITALEWLGGYNALRKTSSLPSEVSTLAKVLFGVGGLVSVIAGFMFCVLVFRILYKARNVVNVPSN